jgi:hypothetical protein
MLKKPLFIEAFALLAITGILDKVANIYHLYWSTSEFDSMVHFFGGAAVSASFLWLYFFSGFFNPPKRNLKNFLTVSILGGMFIGIMWEALELLVGAEMIHKAGYPLDATMDLIMDSLGGMAICLYGYLKETKFQEPKLQMEDPNPTPNPFP